MTRDDERTREAQRILERMNGESEGSPMEVVSRTAARGRDHFSAVDADESDRIEVWGTRIGRMISIILLLAVVAYLGWLVLQG
ncbi:hypothetical protein JYU29_12760 [Tianweitania sp. BSSL-BM11]|uniref:Uncharacterized protein n=1 Tax=Tianweitania aestuarii TaxID=2814886 RepID=A0ABS5RWU7_9HYPH|nr:hypothetical protein [Tianweitania aestuarii]MBS9721555.1 hypothetical protein [Tianweitania aestuarii]